MNAGNLLAFIGGALLGGATAAIMMEKRAREVDTVYKYIECERAHVEAEEALNEEDKVVSDHLQIKLWEDEAEEISVVSAEVSSPVIVELDAHTDYGKAIRATETSHETFVAGGVNDYGVSYIEEEDYHDDGDGRFKGRIDIMMDEHQPIFLMDGQPIDDWDKRLGDSILVDFYKLVPPGIDPVLYVRNHRTGEDYEVVQVSQ